MGRHCGPLGLSSTEKELTMLSSSECISARRRGTSPIYCSTWK